jgi:Ni,Fe-hydrogenase III large subunit
MSQKCSGDVMTRLVGTLAEARRVDDSRPWPRFAVDAGTWRDVTDRLGTGELTLFSLWADPAAVHMAVLEEMEAALTIVSLVCPEGRFPSVGRIHPPAIRLERAICDLFGFVTEGSPDNRPWLDHGRWGVAHPLGANRRNDTAPARYAFLPVDGEDLHQVPVGPVHAGIIEPGHFRFTASGEAVVRLEERLGYVHKGVDYLMRNATLAHGANLAGRVSGDSTVAYAFAYALAVEHALGIDPPPRARWLRALMAELERIANHFGDFGAICNDASFSVIHAHCGILREMTLRAADACFGHRLMRDRIVPGGVTADLSPAGIAVLGALVDNLRPRFAQLVALYDETASLQDRTVSTGRLAPALARQFGAGGFVGRGSGRAFDARRMLAYSPYDRLTFEVPTFDQGDVNARVWVRVREIEQSLSLVEQIVGAMPQGPIVAETGGTRQSGEGTGIVEAFRGDLFVWISITDRRIVRCHLRDASWFQWPLLEAVIEGNIIADFPLCNKSFNCSYSGHDL